jgi:hypothetical protein
MRSYDPITYLVSSIVGFPRPFKGDLHLTANPSWVVPGEWQGSREYTYLHASGALGYCFGARCAP